MNHANSGNRLSSLPHFLDLLEYDYFENNNEDDENYNRFLRLATDNVNMNVRSCGPQKIVKDVGVQTIPEVDDVYIPWLLEAERKTEDFYVQLSNLVNTLYHSQSKVPKTKIKASPPPGVSIISNTHSEKQCRQNINTKSSGHTKLSDGRSKNLEHVAIFQLIEDRIHSIRKSAMELKSSIPKIGLEQKDEIGEYEIVKSKSVKETNILKVERSKSSLHKTVSLPTQAYKMKRGNTLPTFSESKSVERQIHDTSKPLSHGAGKSDNIYFVPKTKSVVTEKNTASGTSRQACNAQAKQVSPKELEVPSKETGAIPKTREGRRTTSANTVNRTQKAKKTNAKPLWR